jgi:hypothetical protein
VSAVDEVLAAVRLADVAEALRIARRVPVLRYPWDGLEDRFRGGGLPLVGYGSLVNAASAAVTLGPETVAALEPVVAFGGRRLFDYAMKEIPPRYDVPAGPRERAALDVRVTDDPRDAFNGVRLVLPPEDVEAFREREKEYDLTPFVCLPWSDLDAVPDLVWGLTCPDPARDVDPHPRYVEVCREGARSFGEDFLAFWRATTYLADGVTLLDE